VILPAAALLLPVLALASAAEDPQPYPAREVLEAFATACSGIEIPAVASASLQAAGWEAIDPAADSQIGRILAGGRAAMEAADVADPEGPQTTMTDGGTYRREVAGRELFAIVSGVVLDDVASYGCRIYDLSAPAPLTPDELESWAVRKPQMVPTGLPGATKHVWNPGLKPGHIEMEVSFVPRGTRLPAPIADIPLSGLVMTASALEFLDS
jgi:hypothetical protein